MAPHANGHVLQPPAEVQEEAVAENIIQAVAHCPGRLQTVYDVGKAVGKGGYAIVYRGVRKEDGRVIAVKKVEIFEMSPKKRDRCLQEVTLLAQLKHPYIIQMLDAFIDENMLIIIFEWAPAGDLKRLIKKTAEAQRTLDEPAIWSLFAQVTNGLRYMHQHRIMHRDIKPANVLVGANGALKLGDLGLGRQLSEQTMEAFSKVGTPYYVSPEVVRGAGYDWKSDVWSLGCLLYELACLRSPFEMEGANLYDVFQKISKGRYEPLPADQFSPTLRQLVTSMLAVDPAGRPDLDEVWAVTSGVIEAQARGQQDVYSASELIHARLLVLEEECNRAADTPKSAPSTPADGKTGRRTSSKAGRDGKPPRDTSKKQPAGLPTPPKGTLRLIHPAYFACPLGSMPAFPAFLGFTSEGEQAKQQLGTYLTVFAWLLRVGGWTDLAPNVESHIAQVPLPNSRPAPRPRSREPPIVRPTSRERAGTPDQNGLGFAPHHHPQHTHPHGSRGSTPTHQQHQQHQQQQQGSGRRSRPSSRESNSSADVRNVGGAGANGDAGLDQRRPSYREVVAGGTPAQPRSREHHHQQQQQQREGEVGSGRGNSHVRPRSREDVGAGAANSPLVPVPPPPRAPLLSTLPVCTNLLKGAEAAKQSAQQAGVSTDFVPIVALAAGHGRAPCTLMLSLLDAVASRVPIAPRQPLYDPSDAAAVAAAQAAAARSGSRSGSQSGSRTGSRAESRSGRAGQRPSSKDSTHAREATPTATARANSAGVIPAAANSAAANSAAADGAAADAAFGSSRSARLDGMSSAAQHSTEHDEDENEDDEDSAVLTAASQLPAAYLQCDSENEGEGGFPGAQRAQHHSGVGGSVRERRSRHVQSRQQQQQQGSMQQQQQQEEQQGQQVQGLLVPQVDPVAWRTEVERLGPALTRIRVQDGGLNAGLSAWTLKWEQTRQTMRDFKACGPQVVASLDGVTKQLSRELETLQSREARINQDPQFAGQLGRFAQMRSTLEGLQGRLAEREQQIQHANAELARLQGRLASIQEELALKMGDLDGSAQLAQMRAAIRSVKEEMGGMDVRLGVLRQSVFSRQHTHMKLLHQVPSRQGRER